MKNLFFLLPVFFVFMMLSQAFGGEYLNLLSKRYSGRNFDPTKTLTPSQLQAISEAGRLTPSSYNEQPWAFIICHRITHQEAFDKALQALVPANQEWAKKASVLIVVTYALKSAKGDINRWAPSDTGAAVFSMMMEAASQGLMAHQMGGFDASKLRLAFAIPEDFMPMAVLAIGYPSENEIPPPKKRKPLEDNFFQGKWGKG